MDDKYTAVMMIIECELQDVERREELAERYPNRELERELSIIRHTLERLRATIKLSIGA